MKRRSKSNRRRRTPPPRHMCSPMYCCTFLAATGVVEQRLKSTIPQSHYASVLTPHLQLSCLIASIFAMATLERICALAAGVRFLLNRRPVLDRPVAGAAAVDAVRRLVAAAPAVPPGAAPAAPASPPLLEAMLAASGSATMLMTAAAAAPLLDVRGRPPNALLRVLLLLLLHAGGDGAATPPLVGRHLWFVTWGSQPPAVPLPRGMLGSAMKAIRAAVCGTPFFADTQDPQDCKIDVLSGHTYPQTRPRRPRPSQLEPEQQPTEPGSSTTMAFVSLPTAWVLGNVQRFSWKSNGRSAVHHQAAPAPLHRLSAGMSMSRRGGEPLVHRANKKRPRGTDNPHSRLFVKEVRGNVGEPRVVALLAKCRLDAIRSSI